MTKQTPIEPGEEGDFYVFDIKGLYVVFFSNSDAQNGSIDITGPSYIHESASIFISWAHESFFCFTILFP